MKTHFLRLLTAVATLALLHVTAPIAHAQWQAQTVTLKPGWNAVFLHVDATHVALDSLIVGAANPIAEVWLWQAPVSTLQFTESPAQPSAANSQWAVWDRSPVVTDSLTRLIGNAAYLVRNTNTVDYVWTITGKPVPPRYQWTTTGLNFVGFPTPTNAPPDFDTFLGPAPEFQRTAELYRYPGGELGATNPARVFAPLFRNTYVKRGEAFWIRRTDTGYNRYFGPVEVELQSGSGVHFADSIGTHRVRLKNLTASARTMTLNLLNSLTPPAGQPAIFAAPPLLVRGALNATNLTYAHTALTGQQSFTLAAQGQPGSELEVVLGLNRSAMVASPGAFYAGVLRWADTGGLSQIDVPVSATVATADGLWVGDASVTQVGQYLKTYQRDANGQPVLAPIDANGAAYVATATNTALGSVARAFPLRIILVNALTTTNFFTTNNVVTTNSAATTNNITTNAVITTTGFTTPNVSLLQRVYYGQRFGTNIVVATREALLDTATLGNARRISASHLPFSHTNTFWPRTSGELRQGTNLVFNVPLDYNDQASNPFLHTFHPDHDNLKTDFRTVEVQGNESYRVVRQITLSFTPPAADFASLTASRQALGGDYSEVVTVSGLSGHTRQFNLRGRFSLNRLSSIATLTTQ